ncbi:MULTISPECIES: spore coat protein [Bacillus]|uniref:Spore coat protein n=1 Tax=Bacillus rugosus TaxID=2715209 RepID=A0ACD4A0X1_9BACI|nr:MULTISPECIES: spore coat protein [Bacillus]MBY4605716.1 spore coat protein [Bacillus sp. SPARC3]UPV79889.1 spore coat protein [Bacillus rugosus]
MKLPAADLGIMAEHLSTHEGVISKLKAYESAVRHNDLRYLLHLHASLLRSHVTAMLALIDPAQTSEVHLPEMPLVHFYQLSRALSAAEKDIALEARSTAKLMGSDNFNSALMMKHPNVRNIHLQMSFQDAALQMLYTLLIRRGNGEFVPMASEQMQRLTLQNYQHVGNE